MDNLLLHEHVDEYTKSSATEVHHLCVVEASQSAQQTACCSQKTMPPEQKQPTYLFWIYWIHAGTLQRQGRGCDPVLHLLEHHWYVD